MSVSDLSNGIVCKYNFEFVQSMKIRIIREKLFFFLNIYGDLIFRRQYCFLYYNLLFR